MAIAVRNEDHVLLQLNNEKAQALTALMGHMGHDVTTPIFDALVPLCPGVDVAYRLEVKQAARGGERIASLVKVGP